MEYDRNPTMSNFTELSNDAPAFQWTIYFITITIITVCLNTMSVLLGLGNIATIGFTFNQKHAKKAFNIYVCAMAIGDLICSDLVAVMDLYDLMELLLVGKQQHKVNCIWCTIQVCMFNSEYYLQLTAKFE